MQRFSDVFLWEYADMNSKPDMIIFRNCHLLKRIGKHGVGKRFDSITFQVVPMILMIDDEPFPLTVHWQEDSCFEYMGLFVYKKYKIKETGEIMFEDVSFIRMFPDEDFVPCKTVGVCLNPSNGMVFLYNNIDDVSRVTHINEWSNRIYRTE